MSTGYTWVQWSPHKRLYDGLAASAVVLWIGAFTVLGKRLWHGDHAISDEVLLIRATGSCAIVLLHVILAIGPLARLDTRFLPILYNRRHLGVMTFLIALIHAALVTGYYHGFGALNPLVSLLTSSTRFSSWQGFPFELPGIAALAIMFLMAATSHDFWLRNLTPVTWKRLHMLVYVAYALLIAHVALGALQTDRGATAPLLVGLGLVVVTLLHVVSARGEARRDSGPPEKADPEASWLDVGSPDDIPLDRARTVCTAGGERIAVFRSKNTISAVTNVCAHQGGPLGEGKIIDGCITCPWHGWQYRPQDGCSPPPFTEKIETYQVRVLAGRVQVRTRALPPGTPVEPAQIGGPSDA